MNFSVLRTGIVNILRESFGGVIPVILENQNGKRPDPPYIAYNLNGFDGVNIAETLPPKETAPESDEFERVIKTDNEFTLSVNYYGDNAVDKCHNAKMLMNTELIKNLLKSLGLVFWDIEPVQDLASLMSTEFEERANMDIMCRIGDSIIETIGIIKSASGTVTGIDSAGNEKDFGTWDTKEN